MLRIPVPVTFNPGWGWIILARFDFKETRRAGDLEPITPSARGMEATQVSHPSDRQGGFPRPGLKGYL